MQQARLRTILTAAAESFHAPASTFHLLGIFFIRPAFFSSFSWQAASQYNGRPLLRRVLTLIVDCKSGLRWSCTTPTYFPTFARGIASDTPRPCTGILSFLVYATLCRFVLRLVLNLQVRGVLANPISQLRIIISYCDEQLEFDHGVAISHASLWWLQHR